MENLTLRWWGFNQQVETLWVRRIANDSFHSNCGCGSFVLRNWCDASWRWLSSRFTRWWCWSDIGETRILLHCVVISFGRSFDFHCGCFRFINKFFIGSVGTETKKILNLKKTQLHYIVHFWDLGLAFRVISLRFWRCIGILFSFLILALGLCDGNCAWEAQDGYRNVRCKIYEKFQLLPVNQIAIVVVFIRYLRHRAVECLKVRNTFQINNLCCLVNFHDVFVVALLLSEWKKCCKI